MASSNIKLFDENKGNMLSDSEFNISNQRMNGLQTGVASSQLQNKAMYQASLMAYAIAQVMMQNGKNANDTDAVSAFVANLSGTMLQKVYDIATTAEAQAGVATGKWMSPALVKTAMNYMLANPVAFGSTVTLAGDPTENLQAATKQYVDKSKSMLYYLLQEDTFTLSNTVGEQYSKNVVLGNNLECDELLIELNPNMKLTVGGRDGFRYVHADLMLGSMYLIAFGSYYTGTYTNNIKTRIRLPFAFTGNVSGGNIIRCFEYPPSSNGDSHPSGGFFEFSNSKSVKLYFYFRVGDSMTGTLSGSINYKIYRGVLNK